MDERGDVDDEATSNLFFGVPWAYNIIILCVKETEQIEMRNSTYGIRTFYTLLLVPSWYMIEGKLGFGLTKFLIRRETVNLIVQVPRINVLRNHLEVCFQEQL